jgi:hypothetical protein
LCCSSVTLSGYRSLRNLPPETTNLELDLRQGRILFFYLQRPDWLRAISSVLSNGFFFSMALPAHSGPWSLIQFRKHSFTDGRAPWTSDQHVARPLPKQRTTQTQNKRIHTPNIHALCGIRNHEPSVRESEDSLLSGYRDVIPGCKAAKLSESGADHSPSSNGEIIMPGAIYPLSHKSSWLRRGTTYKDHQNVRPTTFSHTFHTFKINLMEPRNSCLETINETYRESECVTVSEHHVEEA